MVLCRMKIYEMKKGGRYGIGFIDPNTINEYTWKLDPYYKKKCRGKHARVLQAPQIQ